MPTKKTSSNRPGKSSVPSDTARGRALEQFREDSTGQVLTTDQGLRVDERDLLAQDEVLEEGRPHRDWSRESKA